jgi:hypothetical protein
MNTSLQDFCRSIERVPGLSAVSAEWRRELGAEWSWAQHLLRATDQHADSFPKLGDARAPAARFRIVWRDEAADLYVGSCPDQSGSVELRGADLMVYELDRRALAERVASAMRLVFDFELLDDPPHTCRVGAYSRLGINQAWAYFAVPPGPGELSAALASFAGRERPFVLLTPTRSAWCGRHQTLPQDAALIALTEVLDLDDAGTFRATPAVSALFDRLCPKTVGGVTGAVFRRIGKGRLLVFEDRMEVVRETKGCEYIAFLLANRGVPQHASEVVVGGAKSNELTTLARRRGEAVFDRAGWAELKDRSATLLAEVAEARRRGDHAAEDRAQAEITAIAAQADRARGKGGRDRRLLSASERTRKAVWIAIDRALKEIKSVHEPLWQHLHTSIVRGTFLLYSPPIPLPWQL